MLWICVAVIAMCLFFNGYDCSEFIFLEKPLANVLFIYFLLHFSLFF